MHVAFMFDKTVGDGRASNGRPTGGPQGGQRPLVVSGGRIQCWAARVPTVVRAYGKKNVENERERERKACRSALAPYPPSTKPALPLFFRPWAVNLAGIPIWCTFGPVEAGSIGRRLGNASAGAEMSTARVTPFMKQEKNVLHAVYSSASCGLAWWNRNLRPCVRWPLEEMEVCLSIDPPFVLFVLLAYVCVPSLSPLSLPPVRPSPLL